MDIYSIFGTVPVTALVGIGTGVVGFAVAVIGRYFYDKMNAAKIEAEHKKWADEARKEADNIIKAAKLEASSELIKRREESTQEFNQIRNELREQEKRLTRREDAAQRLSELAAEKEKQIELSERRMSDRQTAVDRKEKQITEIMNEQKKKLFQLTNMNVDEARELLLKRLEDECEYEMNTLIKKKIEETNDTVEQKAREIISLSIQRYAADQACENCVASVDIPNDDMKGRIIGREGRNIRAFEMATGVDVIVDDTPGVIVISCFDPIRRETARLSMEKLIQDGRIHPTRIEEIVAQSLKEVKAKVLQIGKEAAVEVDVRGLNNRILEKLGTLHFRTSYGQNVLRHDIEVAFLAQVMADELGLDGSVARRAGLLHDIGKAMDHEVEGGHPAIGANFLKRFSESSVIINCVEAHHGDVVADNPYSPLIAAADAISAARPGARRETLERYVKRLEKLEEIASSFRGVTNCYAIQAGREVRVIIDAENVNDEAATKVARDIAKKIEDEMTYPGEIKVTLLRELRCVEYAR
ncbi:Ribonuclease Y [Limihaloglobus sulfuriphilus]|uniref:Ribonuclease Y n=1 Tax=Limihaloglobus sulfuriphilus TaxID=1851148 RepID=A0A1Q2MGG3_9BACT|nr:ribonuclease Y [Limihaloglobus sulfuriphilus]AQQ71770.1 Ribonuclease Y [Limihaloglobus sulfuriphilus]